MPSWESISTIRRQKSKPKPETRRKRRTKNLRERRNSRGLSGKSKSLVTDEDVRPTMSSLKSSSVPSDFSSSVSSVFQVCGFPRLVHLPQCLATHIQIKRRPQRHQGHARNGVGGGHQVAEESGQQAADGRQAEEGRGIDTHGASAHLVVGQVLQQGVERGRHEDQAVTSQHREHGRQKKRF